MKNTTAAIGFLVVALMATSVMVGQKTNKDPHRDSSPKENNASLEETFDWLKARLSVTAEFWTDNELRRISYRMIRMNGCNLTWRLESYVDRKFLTYEYTASLGDLDPSNVTVEKDRENWKLTLNTYNKKLAIKSHRIEESGAVGDEFGFYDFPFYINDEKLAPRIANAFSRAIKLCGGKKEPF